MESVARRTLADLEQPEGYLGWTMVVLASAFWQDQVAAVPPERRLFLLPHCLKHAEGCPADYSVFGLDCKECGACSIAGFRAVAEEMGYKVLVAEGSPIVMKIIVSGHVDAIVGVACLNVLERAIDKVLQVGIPCMAVPLLSSNCRNTSVDEDWVQEMVQGCRPAPVVRTRTYVHLMRLARRMFVPDEFQRLVPRARGEVPLPRMLGSDWDALDPIAATEALAHDFMVKGGKHSRPFVTLATYDALTGARATRSDGAKHLDSVPDAVRRVAISIEAFHKASLVHDDIEDDDAYRYGAATLHEEYGVATAINVGDYLIGLGYRLVASESATLGAETAADILQRLADAHTKLSEGQGAELMWRDARRKVLTPLDALKIYALKTAPAFEAALFAGLRLGGAIDAYQEPVKRFARNLGVAFQIINDLDDWLLDEDNKRSAGADLLKRRPTVLWALASESLAEPERAEIERLLDQGDRDAAMPRVRRLYERAGVFQKAHRLVDKFEQRARDVADEVQPEELGRLFHFLIDTVLERSAEDPPLLISPTLPSESAVVA